MMLSQVSDSSVVFFILNCLKHLVLSKLYCMGWEVKIIVSNTRFEVGGSISLLFIWRDVIQIVVLYSFSWSNYKVGDALWKASRISIPNICLSELYIHADRHFIRFYLKT